MKAAACALFPVILHSTAPGLRRHEQLESACVPQLSVLHEAECHAPAAPFSLAGTSCLLLHCCVAFIFRRCIQVAESSLSMGSITETDIYVMQFRPLGYNRWVARVRAR
jgi:hypothetical protein